MKKKRGDAKNESVEEEKTLEKTRERFLFSRRETAFFHTKNWSETAREERLNGRNET